MAPASAAVTADAFASWWLASARRCAARTAVRAPDGEFTHAAVVAKASALAQRLRTLGVDRDSIVGVSVPRGARELIAMLATWLAGGAYVPLPPTHPEQRLRLVIEGAAPQVLIATAASPILPGFGGPVIRVDDLEAAIDHYPSTPPWLPDDPGRLAYVMYTSGSTGRPKGVEIERGSVVNFLRSMAHTPGMDGRDRVLAVTTIGFDIAALELLLPLAVGAEIVIASADDARDPRALMRHLAEHDITLMQATPATWRLLVDAGFRSHVGLTMLCGGEALSRALAERLLEGGGALWNMYGPTETTVWSSLERVRPGGETIAIGGPIDATELRVLDEANRRAPPGEAGQLAIGGAGVARGYRGMPELTAKRFVTLDDGARLYLTGDMVRPLPDGRLQWSGRIDHQLKIRGFRVEPGEIEAVLRGCDGVAEIVVVGVPEPEGSGDGGLRLCAYVVGSAAPAQLQQYAAARLPPYMQPSVWVELPQMPLSPSGKIDRAALPRPHDHVRSAAAAAAPEPMPAMDDRTAQVAAIFAEVLRLPAVRPDRSFFELGGTSLLAAQAALQLERALQLELPVARLFEFPTAAELARNLGAAQDRPIVAWLRRGSSDRPPLFCLFGIQLYQALADALPPGCSVVGMHVPHRYVPGRDPRPSLEQMATRYVALLREQQRRGPYRLLGLCYGGIVAFEAARQLEAIGETVELVCIVDAVLPSAVEVDAVKRLWSYAEAAGRFARERGELTRFVRRRSEQLAARFPVLATLRKVAATPASEAGAVDLPIDGAEVDAEVQRFSRRDATVQAPVHVVRATREPWPRWMSIAPDQGWAGRGGSVLVHEVDSDHRGVMRQPYVQVIADALAGVLER
ncbi:MAG: amino acid adenylation domain-containing protein [Nannocystaceae bacterium]|nr:amino acid adenylation domain-containing protein [Nannocystaceae bacterium]